MRMWQTRCVTCFRHPLPYSLSTRDRQRVCVNQAGLEMLRLVVREQAATIEAQAATIEALRVEQAAQCKSGF